MRLRRSAGGSEIIETEGEAGHEERDTERQLRGPFELIPTNGLTKQSCSWIWTRGGTSCVTTVYGTCRGEGIET